MKKELEKLNELLQEAINEFNSNDSEIYLSISTGIAYKGKEYKNMDEIFKEADKNMYSHKISQKKNTVRK